MKIPSSLLSVGELNLVLILAALLFFVVLAGLIVFAWYRVAFRRTTDELSRLQEVLTGLHGTRKLEDNLSHILSIINKIIVAPYMAFYVLDSRSNRYMLRAAIHPYDDFGAIGPSYSGLALPRRESQIPPLVMEPDDKWSSVQSTMDGEVPILILRTRGRRALIRIGPVGKISKRTRVVLRDFLRMVENLLDDFVQLEVQRLQQEVEDLADSAVKRVAALAIDTNSAVEIIIRAFAGVSGGVGGVFFEISSDRHVTNVYGVGKVAPVARTLETDTTALEAVTRLLGDSPYLLFTRSDSAFYELPECVSSLDVGAVALVSVEHRGLLMFFYDSQFNPEDFVENGMGQIRVLYTQLNKVTVQSNAQKKLSRAYAQLLSQMMSMVDNLNPYTVGYSDMAMRYSLVIGKELDLSEEEMRDLALAAYLSNIGVIGLNMELLVKEGSYTDFEYETIKLHCEIGASMIQVATGNQRAASYVLYHHERVDGQGYPHNLKGTEIPIGARILHVVQVFLAKVNGRAWRDPISFDKVLDELREVSGKQLDPEVVQALFQWLQKRQSSPEVKGKSLGKCYEMCCVPQAICETCPVFHRADVNCWEVGNNHCANHGRECSSCFVRTEFMHREQLSHLMEQRSWQGEYMR